MSDEQPKRGNPAWKPGGESPNPGGRPRAFREYQQWLSENALEKAKARLLEMLDKDADPKAQAFAIKEVNDRLFGKAPQAITGQDGGPLLGGQDGLIEVLKKLAER